MRFLFGTYARYWKGNCDSCDQKMEQKCYCGKVTEMRICGSETAVDNSNPSDPRYFSCGNPCERFANVMFKYVDNKYNYSHNILFFFIVCPLLVIVHPEYWIVVFTNALRNVILVHVNHVLFNLLFSSSVLVGKHF
jgi:hypothetical protein